MHEPIETQRPRLIGIITACLLGVVLVSDCSGSGTYDLDCRGTRFEPYNGGTLPESFRLRINLRDGTFCEDVCPLRWDQISKVDGSTLVLLDHVTPLTQGVLIGVQQFDLRSGVFTGRVTFSVGGPDYTRSASCVARPWHRNLVEAVQRFGGKIP